MEAIVAGEIARRERLRKNLRLAELADQLLEEVIVPRQQPDINRVAQLRLETRRPDQVCKKQNRQSRSRGWSGR